MLSMQHFKWHYPQYALIPRVTYGMVQKINNMIALRFLNFFFFGLVLLALYACTPPLEQTAQTLTWADLKPADEAVLDSPTPQNTPDAPLGGLNTRKHEQVQNYAVVDTLDGVRAQIPGYLLPIDYAEAGAARVFLLLPYHGACIHAPPPPPNQIVVVETETPYTVGELWQPVWVTGTLSIERTDTELANAAYQLSAESIRPYEAP